MPENELNRWIALYRDFLMFDRDGTLADVFESAQEWLTTSRFFPTVADLAPLVERRVTKRLNAASTRAAFHEPPALPAKGRDWSKVATHRLPFTYDYTKDPHWQAGIALMTRAVKAKGDLGPMGNMAREMAKKMGLGDD